MSPSHQQVAALVTALVFAATAEASDPFSLTAQTTGATPTSVSAAGHSLLNLTQDLIQTKSAFAALNGQPFDASVRYGGLNNAFLYSQNAAATSSTLSIPSIGFTHTFTGATSGDLNTSIRNYLKQDGAAVYSQFLHSVNLSTDLGVTDGNPLANTALLGNFTYEHFGLDRAPSIPLGGDVPSDERAPGGFTGDLRGGFFDTADGSGYFGQVNLSQDFRISNRVSLSIGGLVNYRDVDGAQVYNIGAEVALPILLIPSTGNRSFSWQLTPSAVAGGTGSVDLASGGLLYGAGITSSASYRIDPLTFTLADQYTYFEGFPVGVGDYHFDTNVEQQLLKNGGMVTLAFTSNFAIQAGVTYTNFLNAAHVRNYWSPQAGILLRINDRSGIRLSYEGDYAGGYRVTSGMLQFYLGF